MLQVRSHFRRGWSVGVKTGGPNHDGDQVRALLNVALEAILGIMQSEGYYV